ncbi:pantoate kinase [Thermococcus litoralis DSM 5473]|uniref:Pantoate kinase n=1 Tax=Thermococcus litoralis (strain ATCC 51850 / DSM 5473 / JCM 8560 / NS-C) TaxID=523849 RepID=H3ZN24_THELN|nr:pantoate kinase [Thermococcus litoralis]EHR78641.1 pantoate kinase [Thermococcus litoralis DSM 5473]
MLIRAFVPAHITAFFVPKFNEEPLLAGSLGAGINLSKGTNVFVSLEEGLEKHIHIAFNGEPVKKENAIISYSVANEIVPENFIGEVEIWQYFDFPNGHGFGNSAGGALGTALSLAFAFKEKTFLQAAQIAHKHEVIHKGGLGDVIAQIHGGIEIRIKPGAPGIGIVDNIFFEGYKVLAVPMGRLSTREVLDSDFIRLIKKEGEKALNALLSNPKVDVLMKEARGFAERTGLLSGELLEIAKEIDKALHLPSSMIMLGKSLFALLKENEVEKVKFLLDDLSIDEYHICDVYTQRPSVERWVGDGK